jgi:hypothetical protein
MSHVWTPGHEFGFSGSKVLCSRTLSCALSPMGLVPAAVSPRMSGLLQNLRIHQKSIAILPLPLVLLADLAAGRIRSNVTEGVRARRVNGLVVFTIALAGLANQLQKERGLSAVCIGNPSSGPQNVNR